MVTHQGIINRQIHVQRALNRQEHQDRKLLRLPVNRKLRENIPVQREVLHLHLHQEAIQVAADLPVVVHQVADRPEETGRIYNTHTDFMKFKNIILLTGMLLPVSSVFAQYAEDALRFSQSEYGATSRFRALGGAQTALGGDLSSLAANPAGLGLLTKSELSFTPDISNSNVKSNYLGNSMSIQKDRAGINQLGIAFYNPAKRYNTDEAKKGWISYNFGIAYNKTNNFNATTEYGGINPRSSFGDYMSNLATDPNDDLATAGYDQHLVELDAPSQSYFPITDINNNQQNTDFRTGSQSEVNFSLGANYSNQFYIGGSIGLSSINFNADREFIESGQTLDQAGIDEAGLSVYDETVPYLDADYRLSYRSNQETRGTGVNAKIGMIYRASPNVRLGLNFVTPTWYSINDTYSEGLATRFGQSNGQIENFNTNDEFSDLNYSLRTPYKVNGGIAFIAGNLGLLSADVEYVDYASMHFSSSDDRQTTNNMNQDIRDLYQSALNFRVGGEIKLNPVMLRAGFNSVGNPYQNADFSSNTISAGLGYRVNNFSFDLTLSSLTTKYSTSPYFISDDYRYYSSTGSGEPASITNTRNNVFATVGLRF